MNVSTTFIVIIHRLQNYSTMFKTYETELDGFSNKLGFSKRSFAEWGSQIKQSFNDARESLEGLKGVLKGVKEAFITAFKAPEISNEIKLIKETDFSSVFHVESAKDFFNTFNKEGSQSIATLTQWCDQFEEMDDTMRSYLTDCMKNQVPASFDGYNKYVQNAIANNKQLSLSAKAGQVALKGLAFAGKLAASIGLSLAINAIVTWITEFVNSY